MQKIQYSVILIKIKYFGTVTHITCNGWPWCLHGVQYCVAALSFVHWHSIGRQQDNSLCIFFCYLSKY